MFNNGTECAKIFFNTFFNILMKIQTFRLTLLQQHAKSSATQVGELDHFGIT